MKGDKASTNVLSKYAEFANDFLPKLIAELLKYGINDHAINLVDDRQPLYSPIYSLEPVKLGTLKGYIKNNLAKSFIRPSKSSIGVPIFYDKRSHGSLRLYINYQDLNNLTINN